jgi:hypothetical protein
MTDRSPHIRLTAMLADFNPSGGLIGDDSRLRALDQPNHTRSP